MSRPSQVLVLLLLLGVAALAKPSNFWKQESERSGETTLTTYAALKAPAKGQGVLMVAQWPAGKSAPPALEPSEVLSSLYRDLKDFELLGSKEVSWGGQAARLVSFKALVGKRAVIGRALLAQPEAAGTEALLLVVNRGSEKDFAKEFERLQSRWEFGRPPASNVLYSD